MPEETKPMSTSGLQEKITSIKAEIELGEHNLSRLREELYRLELEQANIILGMLVRCDGKVYKVTGAQYLSSHHEQPWLRGQLQRKDGTFGVSRHLYRNWERIEVSS
jgi:hypothetical protein